MSLLTVLVSSGVALSSAKVTTDGVKSDLAGEVAPETKGYWMLLLSHVSG